MKSTNIRTENWNGQEIRFIEKKLDEWWAVSQDVAKALDYNKLDAMIRKLRPEQKGTHLMSTPGGNQVLSIISETGVYKVIMRSRKKEAEDFEQWVYEVIKQLRKSAGLEGFQIFCMLDKEHQKETMSKLSKSLDNPVRVDFIKANTIANKAVSSMNRHPKMLKKDQMTPDMLIQRQRVLDDTVDLMSLTSKFDIGISVSETIYNKYVQ